MTNTSSKYKEEVLGKHVIMLFCVANRALQPFMGQIRAMQVALRDDDDGNDDEIGRQEGGPGREEDRLETMHFVVFTDGDEFWFDLEKEERDNNLTWVNYDRLGNLLLDPTADAAVVVSPSPAPAPPAFLAFPPSPSAAAAAAAAAVSSNTSRTTIAAAAAVSTTNSNAVNQHVTPNQKRKAAPISNPQVHYSKKKSKISENSVNASAEAQSYYTQQSTFNAVLPNQAARDHKEQASFKSGLPKAVRPLGIKEISVSDESTCEEEEDKDKESGYDSWSESEVHEKEESDSESECETDAECTTLSDEKTVRSDATISKKNQQESPRDWVDDMYDWLTKVPHGDYKKSWRIASTKNAKSVICQVRKFARGEGTTRSNWPTGVYFLKGTKVDLSFDFDKLFQLAQKHEAKYGADPSRWTLRHPLKKLQLYKAYCDHKHAPVS